MHVGTCFIISHIVYSSLNCFYPAYELVPKSGRVKHYASKGNKRSNMGHSLPSGFYTQGLCEQYIVMSIGIRVDLIYFTS